MQNMPEDTVSQSARAPKKTGFDNIDGLLVVEQDPAMASPLSLQRYHLLILEIEAPVTGPEIPTCHVSSHSTRCTVPQIQSYPWTHSRDTSISDHLRLW